MKALLQFYGYGIAGYSYLVAAIYVPICWKVGIVRFKSTLTMVLYTLLLATSFMCSYLLNLKVIRIWINQRLYDIPAGIIGIKGDIEDIVITSLVMFPCVVILHILFKVQVKSKAVGILYYIVYFILSITAMYLYEGSLQALVNYTVPPL